MHGLDFVDFEDVALPFIQSLSFDGSAQLHGPGTLFLPAFAYLVCESETSVLSGLQQHLCLSCHCPSISHTNIPTFLCSLQTPILP